MAELPERVQAMAEHFRSKGMCGLPSPDGRNMCIKPWPHRIEPCGWDLESDPIAAFEQLVGRLHDEPDNAIARGLLHDAAEALARECVAWRKRAEALWQLLDHIDTADDWAKDNEAAYRTAVRKYAHKRFEWADSDGYTLAWKEGDADATQRHTALERPDVTRTDADSTSTSGAVLAGDLEWLGELQEMAQDGNARLGPQTRAALARAVILDRAELVGWLLESGAVSIHDWDRMPAALRKLVEDSDG